MSGKGTRWPRAALAGMACAMRTTATPALFALRGRISGAPRAALLVAAAGELTVDKTSAATDRIDPPAVIGRAVAGALSGRAIAGPIGALAGGASGAVGSYVTWRARKRVVDVTGLPDPVVAVGEDLVAFAAASVATAPRS